MSEAVGDDVVRKLANEPDLLQRLVELTDDPLQPISPEEGIDRFLEHKETDIRPKTVAEYRRKLDNFRQFCEMRRIDNLNDFTGRQVDDYETWRRKDSPQQSDPLSPKTMRDEMYLLRDFFRYLERIDGLPRDFHEKVDIPKLGPGDGVRDVNMDPARVKHILDYLDTYQYASREHVVWAFYAHTGRRPGCLHSLDVQDLHLDCEDPYLEFRHRPEESSLKNDEGGEGQIGLSETVAQVFKDYVEKNRIEITTEAGREPFLSSRYGRLAKSTMRKYLYKWSRPCAIKEECPHDRDIESCEAANSTDVASKCPSSRPPYGLRHGYISQKRQEGVPGQVLSDRCDVSEEVIEKHYDERDDEQKREFRQRILKKAWEEQGEEGGYL